MRAPPCVTFYTSRCVWQAWLGKDHLLDNHILGGGEFGIEVLGGMDTTGTSDPAAVKCGVAADYDIDLEAGGRMDDVELARSADGVADRIFVEVVILQGIPSRSKTATTYSRSSDGPMRHPVRNFAANALRCPLGVGARKVCFQHTA